MFISFQFLNFSKIINVYIFFCDNTLKIEGKLFYFFFPARKRIQQNNARLKNYGSINYIQPSELCTKYSNSSMTQKTTTYQIKWNRNKYLGTVYRHEIDRIFNSPLWYEDRYTSRSKRHHEYHWMNLLPCFFLIHKI